MMKHYGYSAKEATAWCRVCRPGCVVGPQQQYLETIQERMWQEGRRYRQERQQTAGGGSAQMSHPLSGSLPRGGAAGGGVGKSTRLPQNSEMIDSRSAAHQHVDSALTSRILKKQEAQQSQHSSSPQRVSGGSGVSTGGGGILSRSLNASALEREREREPTPSITRPSTSSGTDAASILNERERRGSRTSTTSNPRKGSGNIDWSLQQETKQLTIATTLSSSSSSSSSRPRTSFTSADQRTGARTHLPHAATTNDVLVSKKSLSSSVGSTPSSGASNSNTSSRTNGSNTNTPTNTATDDRPSSSLTRLLWSSTTKTKIKSSSVSPTPSGSAPSSSSSPHTAAAQGSQAKDSSRKNSFGRAGGLGSSSSGHGTNGSNSSNGMRRLVGR
jgi:hypothetical protein